MTSLSTDDQTGSDSRKTTPSVTSAIVGLLSFVGATIVVGWAFLPSIVSDFAQATAILFHRRLTSSWLAHSWLIVLILSALSLLRPGRTSCEHRRTLIWRVAGGIFRSLPAAAFLAAFLPANGLALLHPDGIPRIGTVFLILVTVGIALLIRRSCAPRNPANPTTLGTP